MTQKVKYICIYCGHVVIIRSLVLVASWPWLNFFCVCHEWCSVVTGPHQIVFLFMNFHTSGRSMSTQALYTSFSIHFSLLVYVIGLSRSDCVHLCWSLLELSSTISIYLEFKRLQGGRRHTNAVQGWKCNPDPIPFLLGWEGPKRRNSWIHITIILIQNAFQGYIFHIFWELQ